MCGSLWNGLRIRRTVAMAWGAGGYRLECARGRLVDTSGWYWGSGIWLVRARGYQHEMPASFLPRDLMQSGLRPLLARRAGKGQCGAVNSQGAPAPVPLERQRTPIPCVSGAHPHAREPPPCSGRNCILTWSYLHTRGSRPWLLTQAPVGASSSLPGRPTAQHQNWRCRLEMGNGTRGLWRASLAGRVLAWGARGDRAVYADGPLVDTSGWYWGLDVVSTGHRTRPAAAALMVIDIFYGRGTDEHFACGLDL